MVSSYAAAAIGAMLVEVRRGALIVLEGLDCSGKSSQLFDLLLAYPRAIHGGLAREAGLLAPDLVLYLDIPAEVAAERGGYGGERYE
ncbi:unnamed protein product [Sphagnum jensenii]|uniref:Thymidylate kinase n=1 Tax=Sphagnum jensenii TaxID=128206 RepID=A0ABP1B705_9BRYO